MAFREAPVLETGRLALRPYRSADFHAFAAYFASPRSRYTDGPIARARASDLFNAGAGRWMIAGHGEWSIRRKGDETSNGLVSLNTDISLPYPELGWILWAGHEGHGYARKAASAARDFAFKALGWPVLLSGIHSENFRSIRLAERMGSVPVAEISVPDEPDTAVYRHAA